MANPEHVKIAKRGADAIAEWRRKRQYKRLRLSEADLSGADLAWADLSGAVLRRADLSGADINRANLSGADLIEAILRGADLGRADLRGADLNGADLSGAEINHANLSGADLSGAGLSNALCHATTFARCDLSRARGLDAVRHTYPSTIGVDTLALTLQGAGGRFTPEQRTFFENAGVPRTLLDYLPGLLETHPIQFFSCFISYGTQDEKFADRLYRDLKGHGVTCYKYDVDALVGRGVWANIDQAIRAHGKTIVICSPSSLQRPGVQREIERALQREDDLTSRQADQPDIKIDTDVLFPVRLDDYVLDKWEHPRQADVTAKHIGDFRGWDQDEANYNRGLEQLLRALDPRSKLGLSKGDLGQLGQG